MKPSYAATLVVDNKFGSLDNGTSVSWVRSLRRAHPRPDGKRVLNQSPDSASVQHIEVCPSAERKHRSPFEILASEEIAVTIINMATGEPIYLPEDGVTVDACALAEKHQDFCSEISSQVETTEEEYSTPIERERAKPKLGSPRKDQALGALIQSRLLTIPQAAAYLNTTEWAIKAMIWNRELPIVPLGKRYMLDTSDLDGVISKRKRLV